MRLAFILNSTADRHAAIGRVLEMPAGTRVEFKPPKRSLSQNAYMWKLLEAFEDQAAWEGQKYSKEVWKFAFLRLLGIETQFAPDLAYRGGNKYFPIGPRSSDLSVEEMSDLIELIQQQAAVRNIVIPAHPRFGPSV